MKLHWGCARIVFAGLLTLTGAYSQSTNPMATRPAPSLPGFFGPVSAHLRAGDSAPDPVFTKVLQPAGATTWNSSLSGKTTVLVFFPLISRNPDPMRTWNAIVHRFAAKPIQFVMITSEKESTLLPWLAQHPVDGAVLYDVEGRTGRAYGLEMPAAVYIDPDRHIIGFQQTIVPDERTLNAVLEGHTTTTRPGNDIASVRAFLASGLVPLDAESARMPQPDADRPDFPPSQTLHVSPAKDEIGSRNSRGDGFWNLQGFTLKSVIAEIYQVNPIRIVLPASLDDGKRYDFALNLPEAMEQEEMRTLVKQGIQNHFHITAQMETRLSDVYLVTALHGTPPTTRARHSTHEMVELSSSSIGVRRYGGAHDISLGEMKPATFDMIDSVSIRDATLDQFCTTLEGTLDRPVVNETNLKGRYDLQVSAGKAEQNSFLQLLQTKLNLSVTPTQRHIEALVFRPD